MDIINPSASSGAELENALSIDDTAGHPLIIPSVNTQAATSRSAVNHHLYTMPIYVPFSMAFDRILCYIISAGLGNGRLGIYNTTKTSNLLTPDSLLVDAGTFAHNTTGEKAIVIDETLAQGWYYLAIQQSADVTYSTPVGVSPTGVPITARGTSLASTLNTCYVTAVADGGAALPDPHPTPDDMIPNSYYVVGLRLA